MPTYRVVVTREITEWAEVTVDAVTADAAVAEVQQQLAAGDTGRYAWESGGLVPDSLIVEDVYDA